MIHALTTPSSAHWGSSVLLSCGRPRQQETALAARSHSRLSGASQRAAPAGQRLLYGFTQAKLALGLEKKAGLWVPQQHELRGDSKHRGLEFPISKCFPNISSYKVIGFSSPTFLRGLTVLHPNSYLEKAATSQIKLHRGFLAPESDRGKLCTPNQPISAAQTRVESGWKTWPKGLTDKGNYYEPFLF